MSHSFSSRAKEVRMHRLVSVRFLNFIFGISLFSALQVCAQAASIRGQVKDESGAMIPGATVTATGATGNVLTAVSAADGSYSLKRVPNGSYRIEAAFTGFEMKDPVAFVERGQDANLNLVLNVSAVVQNVTVEAQDSATVSVDSGNNASAVVLSGSKLDSLADNPDDLASDLQALAGPSAGPNGGSVYINGFSTGEMPPKESIREIRINQNPFSPEYDSLGLGRIEIFTKPGSGQFHGSAAFNLGSSIFNSRNPYAAVKATFLLREFGTSLAGPLGQRASFTFDARGEVTDNGAIINGATLDPASLAIISPYTGVNDVAQHRFFATPDVDYTLNDKHTLSMRYRISQTDIPDSGLGGFNLVESADHAHALVQTAQFVDTDVLSEKAVNETRFQFFNVSSSMAAVNPGPSIQVLSAFTFGGETAPELDANNQVVKDASGNPVLISLSSIQQYQRTLMLQKAGFNTAQIQALGGGASQFSLSAGNPLVSLSQVDAGLFVGNTWKVRQNLTFDLGLRYETQSNIHDRGNFAPRVAASWSPGWSHQKLVLRGGFGIFYDRFALTNTLNAQRYNGVNQQQYVINNPSFYPNVPTAASLAASLQGQVIDLNAPTVRAPYLDRKSTR